MSLLRELAIEFAVGLTELLKVIDSAPRRYKSYEIDKRSGGKRTIAQPAREVKMLQYYIMERKLSAFPIHDIATAYVKGRGILHNANIHKESDLILKLDFKAFFPSIKPVDLEVVNRRHNPHLLSVSDLSFYNKILFWGAGTTNPLCLSIGAPTSPLLSNVIMYDLDCQFYQLAHDLGLRITRYADDITVSGDSETALLRFERRVDAIIKKTRSPKLVFNDEKRGLYRKSERRMVTGLVITPDGAISIGRERKKKISSLIHNFRLGALDEAMTMYAKGMLGFVIAAEPAFLTSMRLKYGDEVIDRLLEAETAARLEQRNDSV